jgi:hypothetical protein
VSAALALAAAAACNKDRAPSCRQAGEPSVAHPARVLPPSRWILGPIYGTGCPDWGPCLNADGTMEGQVLDQLDHLAQNDIPVRAYHFDGGAWSKRLPSEAPANGRCSWNLGDVLLERLRADGVPALLHYWGGCRTTDDFDRVHADLGDVLGGFYLDFGAGDALAQSVTTWVAANLRERGDVVLKAFGDPGETDAVLGAIGHTAYVDDLPNDFPGLQEGIRRVFAKSSLIGTFNEFTGYTNTAPAEEVFFRRIHFGALQLVMDHSPLINADPWSNGYSAALLESYRRFAWLHAELVPYLHSYDRGMYETGAPVLRAPDQARFATLLGDEIFVQYVTEPGVTSMPVQLPPGDWIDGWDESRLVSGAVAQPVPLGREPFFIRSGAILPLDVQRPYAGHGTAASAGSLTLLVAPGGDASFRYFGDDVGDWITFSARATDTGMVLDASSWPAQPMIWRVIRSPERPGSVSLSGRTVTVGDGGGLPELGSEEAVESSTTSAWYHDAAAQALIVKVVPPACPAVLR